MKALAAMRAGLHARLLAPVTATEQPPLLASLPLCLHAAIGSLAIGGAERIVLDWAAAASRNHHVRLLVLRAAPVEWPVPQALEVIRLGSERVTLALEREGARIAATGNAQVLCHLLSAAERAALQRGGAQPIPVLHNARPGWIEPPDALKAVPWTIAVSQAAAAELAHAGVRKVSVVRHIPAKRMPSPEARRYWRDRWEIPQAAFVIGMIGGVKPQKAYPRALRVLSKLLARRDAWLVILGGPTGRNGLLAWQTVIAQCRRLELCERVRMAGFVAHAWRVLPAFDVVLNTSHYEGLSIATLEALAAGLPVVASKVGGQGELNATGLRLVPCDAPLRVWVDALDAAHARANAPPFWLGFPTARLWTLMHLPPIETARSGTLFVTANLNAGGAQRSLANLARFLGRSLPFEIVVCGDSSTAEFTAQLRQAGVRVGRSLGDAFDHAEALLRYAAHRPLRTIVFWNVDAKVKLLITKRLAHSALRLIDVSPGAYAFEEMDATAAFQTGIAYTAAQYYARLQRLVVKYGSAQAPAGAIVTVIPNGVYTPAPGPRIVRAAPRHVVVSGRIAPTKFLLEIVAAMRKVWPHIPDARLHVLGAAEVRHRTYFEALLKAGSDEIGQRMFLHGAAFDAPQRLAQFDLALVIGEHQGCPNAVLEAMAAGLPVVANDSGGTRELVIDGRTGILLRDREPDTIAGGLVRLMNDGGWSSKLAHKGKRHVARRFSMRSMGARYRALLAE